MEVIGALVVYGLVTVVFLLLPRLVVPALGVSLDLRGQTAAALGGTLLGELVALGLLMAWLRRHERSLADLGCGRPTTMPARCYRSAPSWLAKRPMRTSGGVAGQWSSASVGPAAGDVHGARIVPDKGSLPQLKNGQSVDSCRRALRSPRRGSCQTSREADEAKRAKQPPGHSEIAARDQMAQLT